MDQEIIYIIVSVIVFFLLRELWTWYWKINTIINHQKNTEKLLREILKELRNENEPVEPIKKETNSEDEIKEAVDEAMENVKVQRIYVRNKLTGNKKMMPLDEYNSMSDSKKKRWQIID